MKRCRRCGEEKALTEFASNRAKKDRLTNWCRSCKKEYNASYYSRTRDRHNPARAQLRDKHRQENRDRLVRYLQAHPCVDCGEADVVVLQFDHKRDKLGNISDMMYGGSPAILAEIGKCDVVCANCHMRRTARTHGWFKATSMPL